MNDDLRIFFFTIEEAAMACTVQPETIRKWINEDGLKSNKLQMILKQDIAQFVRTKGMPLGELAKYLP